MLLMIDVPLYYWGLLYQLYDKGHRCGLLIVGCVNVNVLHVVQAASIATLNVNTTSEFLFTITTHLPSSLNWNSVHLWVIYLI